MKKTFRIVRLVMIALLCAIFVITYLYLRRPDTRRLPKRYGETIGAYISPMDMDQDGLDDQSDILASALAYLSTRPAYKSAYYDGGYPDDGYGVCTDVIAFGLKGAGYDLSALVDADIADHPDEYADEVRDANIDFRRVCNLKIFFSHSAQSLTTDLKDIAAWQGGDIVIFDDHIGIVSDRRNKDGVPYLIHHASVFQQHYEEDILAKRNDLAAHYRFPKSD